jgi:biopolymer transport protein TolR
MGANLHSSGGGRKRRGSAVRADINMTPMIDVMLVLLIVFMVTAPLMTAGVPVDLPQTEAAPLQESDIEPLMISLNAKGELFLQETPIQATELVPRLQAIVKNKAEQRIFVRADQNLDYGQVMRLMGQITTAGFSKVALITEAAQ